MQEVVIYLDYKELDLAGFSFNNIPGVLLLEIYQDMQLYGDPRSGGI
jgi:hypothetical protein